jgi:SsrA-binding protein
MEIQVISENRKARFDFHIVETFEAGLALMGSEVKALREGLCQLKDSYISFVGDEAFLQKAHIGEYRNSSYNNHKPERYRKLLLHRKELQKIYGSLRERGLSCVPLKMYFKDGRAKLEIALVKGKKDFDKRAAIKKRDVNREVMGAKRHFR